MNNLLNKLIELDKKAKLLEEEVKQETENLEAEIQKEIEVIKNEKMKTADETIADETEKLYAEAEKEWVENSSNCGTVRQKLEENFNNNFDRWVDMIVSDVLA